MKQNMDTQPNEELPEQKKMGSESLVLYCIVRRMEEGEGSARFLLIRKQRDMTFPPTKFRPGEDLFSALIRPMEEDLDLAAGTYFPEQELEMIPNEENGPQYEGLPKKWYLYPVDMSLTREALKKLERSENTVWWMLDEVLANVKEPNVLAIASHLKEEYPQILKEVHKEPSMDALAAHWAARNEGGVRLVRSDEIQRILKSGPRAFNLRVADPYLPYQKQGLGFTWSFFSPKDKQDVHVHGLPAVEIYGVMEGRLQVWYKPMNRRGARAWQHRTLDPGDWLEVEPLNCHFACWLGPKGLGTVVKAAATGELAGVGKLGVSGKTVCRDCNVREQCTLHPWMIELLGEYSKLHEVRDYVRIAALGKEDGKP